MIFTIKGSAQISSVPVIRASLYYMTYARTCGMLLSYVIGVILLMRDDISCLVSYLIRVTFSSSHVEPVESRDTRADEKLYTWYICYRSLEKASQFHLTTEHISSDCDGDCRVSLTPCLCMYRIVVVKGRGLLLFLEFPLYLG